MLLLDTEDSFSLAHLQALSLAHLQALSRKPKRPNQKRQPGSLKIWHNPLNNTIWASVVVHNGRITHTVRGPEARDMETALEMLKNNLNGD